MKRSAYARHARQNSATDISRFFGPSSRSTFSSIGRPWQSYPTHVGRVEPGHRTRLDDQVLENLVQRGADDECSRWRTVVHRAGRTSGASLRLARIFPYRSMPAQRASVCGSLVGRFAFIGKSVRGRLTVSFHSGMGAPSNFIMRVMTRPLRAATLANGLKVLVRRSTPPRSPRSGAGYRVGSKDERPGSTGVSHWVEHMNFKGYDQYSPRQGQRHHRAVWRRLNGYTWIDQTTYFETATRDALDRMLFIEAERMAGCLYDPEDCESERTVIISELQGGENDPDQLLDQELTATAFKAHPYRHPTIGWLSDLQSMTREDLYGYYRRHYIPNNATLVIVVRCRHGRCPAACRASVRGDRAWRRAAAAEPPGAGADG